MYKTVIVILNYQTWRETIECIQSIEQSQMKEVVDIVIVDNASTNSSVKKLHEHYRGCEKIHIICSEKNDGFARGNNVGIKYAKEKLHADFVLCLNNDTLMIEDDYLQKMLRAYKKGIGVIGSKIKLASGLLQAGEWENMTLEGILYQYIRNLCQYYYWYFPFKEEWGGQKQKTVRLHGCAILLTPDFFKKYEQFWKYTFLYREEMILSIMLEKAALKMKIADAYIYHKEGKSTGLFFDKKSRIRQKYDLMSLKQELLVKILPYSIIRKILR